MWSLSSLSHYKTGASSEQNDVGKFQTTLGFQKSTKVGVHAGFTIQDNCRGNTEVIFVHAVTAGGSVKYLPAA